MALWMRRRAARASAAWLAGGLFMFGGYAAGRAGNGIVLFPNTMAWLPWMLLCWDRFSASLEDGGRRGRNLAALTLVLALSILSGAPQIAFYSFAALGLYALVGAWLFRRDGNAESFDAETFDDLSGEEDSLFEPLVRLKPLAALLGAFALAGGICAVQILPSAAFIGESWDRAAGASWEYVVNNSLPPRMLLTAIAPFFFGDPLEEATYWGPLGYHEITAYLGAIPILFLFLFLVGRWGPWRKAWLSDFGEREKTDAVRFEIFLLTLLLLAAIFAFGKHSPFFWLAYHFVPGFDRFRAPARFLLFYTFALAALSGWALDRLTACGESFRKKAQEEKPTMSSEKDWGRVNLWLISVAAVGMVCLAALTERLPLWLDLLKMPLLNPEFGGRTGRFAETIAGLEHQAVRGIAWFTVQWLGGALFLGYFVIGTLWFDKRKTGWAAAAVPWAIVVFCLAVVIFHGRHFLATAPREKLREIYYPQTPRVAFLQEGLRDGGRFLWFDSLMDYRVDQFQPELLMNRPIFFNLPQLRGYDPVNSRRFGLVMNQATNRPLDANPAGFMFVSEGAPEKIDWRLLGLWDCRAALSYRALEDPAIEEAASWAFGSGGTAVLRAYRLKTPAGPARLALPFLVSRETSLEDQALLLGNPAFGAGVVTIVREGEYVPPEDAAPAPNDVRALPRMVRLVEKQAGRFVFEVAAPETAVLVMSQNYYPGWKALVDGKAALVYPADVAQCGVTMPAGKHTVELRYRPRQFYQGLAISLCSVGLLGLLARRLREEN